MAVNTTNMIKLMERGNWDLYIDIDGIIWAKAVDPGCADSYWGNRKHFKKVIGCDLPDTILSKLNK